jgi:hypothetical protein
MIGDHYWTTGVTVKWDGRSKWSASLKFYDAGFCQDDSTEGRLTLRYFVDDITAGIKTLLVDTRALGITCDAINLYVGEDGEGENDAPELPSNWRETLGAVARETGLQFLYA